MARKPSALRRPAEQVPLHEDSFLLRFSARLARYRLALVALAGAWLFGGASRFDTTAPFVASTVAIVVLAMLYTVREVPTLTLLEKIAWGLLAFIFVVQLVPLPPALWTALPGRSFPREVFAQLGERPWLPLSLTPGRTFVSFFAIFPPLAVYLSAKGLSRQEGDRLLAWLVGFAALAALLGLFQFAGGNDTALRFYAVTNRDAAVGFFSNANHFGVWSASLVPVTIYLTLGALTSDARGRKSIAALGFGISALLALGAILSFSRAAYVVLLIATLVSGAGALRFTHITPRKKGMIAGGAALAVVAAMAFVVSTDAFLRMAEVSDIDPTGRRGRLEYVPLFLKIIADTLPFGTGIGSFDPVNRAYETYTDIGRTYLNNAHNEPAQLLIETGILGLAAGAAWLWLFAKRGFGALSDPSRMDAGDLGIFRAVVLILPIFILLAHSLVDYPLRTSAATATFALCLALLAGSKRTTQ